MSIPPIAYIYLLLDPGKGSLKNSRVLSLLVKTVSFTSSRDVQVFT